LEKNRIEKILKDPHILDQLKIELPLNEIEKIFIKFGIIVLRKPKNKNLLFYCGNDPVYSSAMKRSYPNPNNYHAHNGYDTVDCDLLMNPTSVSHSLSEGLKNYFSSIGKKYKRIEGCVMPVIHDADVNHMFGDTCMLLMEKKIDVLNSICDENGAVINAFEIHNIKNKKYISKIIKIAKNHNFETKIIKKHPYFEINFYRPKSKEKVKSL